MLPNFDLKIQEMKKLSSKELEKLASDLGKDKTFTNRRLIQEMAKEITCPHDRESFLQSFDFHSHLQKMDQDFLENLKPL